MNQRDVPLMSVPLLDGRQLSVEADGIHLGERFHPLTQISEARLLFLRPETIALMLANVGQVEYTVARPGDGAALLETLYALRPELRRADAAPPAAEAPAGYFAPIAAPPLPVSPLVNSGYTTPASGSPSAGYAGASFPSRLQRPQGPAPFPPQTLAAYGEHPNRTYAELTPKPRRANQLIGGAFRLFGKRLGAMLALAVLVATIPTALVALLDAVVSALGGVNPMLGAPNPLTTLQQVANGQTPPTASASTATTPLDGVIALLSLAAIVLTLLVAAWGQAALAIGAREALLGRRVSPLGSAREGLVRLWPTLWALSVLYCILAIVAIPGLGLALAFWLGPTTPGTPVAPQDATVFYVLAGSIATVTLLLVAYLWTRLALYPTAAALGHPAPFRLSVGLTNFGLLRVFWALLIVTIVASVFTLSASAAQLWSVAFATIIIAPLAQLIAGPLGALIRVAVLYDQRLRREGYALFESERIAPPLDGQTSGATESSSKERVGL